MNATFFNSPRANIAAWSENHGDAGFGLSPWAHRVRARHVTEFDGAGRLRLIALIEEATVIGRILRHLGVPTEMPPLDYARPMTPFHLDHLPCDR